MPECYSLTKILKLVREIFENTEKPRRSRKRRIYLDPVRNLRMVGDGVLNGIPQSHSPKNF